MREKKYVFLTKNYLLNTDNNNFYFINFFIKTGERYPMLYLKALAPSDRKWHRFLYFATCCPPGGESYRTRSFYPIPCAMLAFGIGVIATSGLCFISQMNYKKDVNAYRGALFSNATKEEIANLKGDVDIDKLIMGVAVFLLVLGVLTYGLAAYSVRKNESNLEKGLLEGRKQNGQNRDYGSAADEFNKTEKPQGKWWKGKCC